MAEMRGDFQNMELERIMNEVQEVTDISISGLQASIEEDIAQTAQQIEKQIETPFPHGSRIYIGRVVRSNPLRQTVYVLLSHIASDDKRLTGELIELPYPKLSYQGIGIEYIPTEGDWIIYYLDDEGYIPIGFVAKRTGEKMDEESKRATVRITSHNFVIELIDDTWQRLQSKYRYAQDTGEDTSDTQEPGILRIRARIPKYEVRLEDEQREYDYIAEFFIDTARNVGIITQNSNNEKTVFLLQGETGNIALSTRSFSLTVNNEESETRIRVDGKGTVKITDKLLVKANDVVIESKNLTINAERLNINANKELNIISKRMSYSVNYLFGYVESYAENKHNIWQVFANRILFDRRT